MTEPRRNPVATVESLDYEGHGVAHVDGKTIFLDGALPFETVEYSSYRKKPTFENAQVTAVLSESFMRTTPKCAHFGVCGGCSLQHAEATAQVAAKQRVMEENLTRIGEVKPQTLLAPIYGPTWGYRHRARLSARYVAKKGTVLVGFHEKRSSFIADMKSCEILPKKISDLLVPLRSLVMALSIRERMPQIELALGEHVDVLVLRIMDPLTPEDEVLVKAFADQYTVQFWLQPKGPDTAHPFYPLNAPQLSYSLPEFGIVMPYKPTEFTQVNPHINNVLVGRAIRMLDPQPGERIADLFCGLGNFTLPIARSGAQVIGIEGSQQLVERAIENAEKNGLADKTEFQMANLFEITEEIMASLGHFDRMVIDPPRDGAMEVCKSIAMENGPKRIIYVSCNPATLARDANVLVNVKGYTMKTAGVVNMFPHTGHVESMAWFEKE
ncbi:23S rRNA (uracil(1939)-C(5))-methyltransferase RlmD [Chitinimonas sp. BJB300]|uniref:23S rRNA (uracil(1939)-C(5))-methyltransferase RlmD n=1 Tax=Chitinimonas sp. BJB300 TaxID=1559339 RepID=UPI000C0E001E|nr:23S rRNA (uracil(1939)-C(5))-methyltransferase RlmD [Chitinimonas sp. BJB300]PHV12580.1 23S rRNA (uracil(1939)-C(5))-methyltransferase RlmD [Chitinimonas sp. BJB300]TSJ90027.1 23S rRNA (uracil(1939)-C(5))-methyltransferase RlmD [Chitinimonas sp. BJB300]